MKQNIVLFSSLGFLFLSYICFNYHYDIKSFLIVKYFSYVKRSYSDKTDDRIKSPITEREFKENNHLEILTNEKKSDLEKVSSLKFNWKINVWEALEHNSINNEIDYLENFKIITYNVWFDRHNFFNRRYALLEIFKNSNADIICLQEVITPFIEYIKNDENIKKKYYISNNMFSYYNVMILSKFPLKIYRLKFQTKMDRHLLIGELKINKNNLNNPDFNNSILFATSHFESLIENAELRKIQFSKAFELLNLFKNALLVGDYNFDDNLNYNEINNLDPLYFDAWKVWMDKDFNLNLQNEDGYTYYEDKTEPPQRIDRILFGKYSNFELKAFDIIGKEKINVDPKYNLSTVETASDHQGLLAEFSLKSSQI